MLLQETWWYGLPETLQVAFGHQSHAFCGSKVALVTPAVSTPPPLSSFHAVRILDEDVVLSSYSQRSNQNTLFHQAFCKFSTTAMTLFHHYGRPPSAPHRL
jgi:hypothetical protein